MYTDGLKDPITEKTGPGVNVNLCKRLTNYISVYSTEMVAIIVGLQWTEEVQPRRLVICWDSASV